MKKVKPEPPIESLTGLSRQYLDHLEARHYSPATIENYRTRLRVFTEWCEAGGITRAADVSLETLEKYTQHLFQRTLVATTRNDILQILRSFFRFLHRRQKILINPTEKLVIVPPKKVERLPITHEQVERLFGAIDVTLPEGLRNRAALELIYSTGMRVSELVGLELYDIDAARRTVLIRHGKGRKQRVVPVGERALQWIDWYLRNARDSLLGATSSTRLFVQLGGGELRRKELSKHVAELAIAAGLRRSFGVHVLRHTAATEMLMRGADTRVLQELLGHSSLASTQRYTHLVVGHLQAVHSATHPAERLDAMPTALNTPAPTQRPIRPKKRRS